MTVLAFPPEYPFMIAGQKAGPSERGKLPSSQNLTVAVQEFSTIVSSYVARSAVEC